MWISIFRSWRRTRRACNAEAARLITLHGEEAVRLARVRVNAALRDDAEGLAEAGGAWCVVHLVERQLGAHYQPDTATRWLEG